MPGKGDIPTGGGGAPPAQPAPASATPAASAAPKPLLPNNGRLGPLRLIGVLGRGGNGTVYEAEDEMLERRLAVKLLPAELVARGSGAVQRFLQEARAACRLEHPNIVTVYHVGQAAGIPFIAMQLVRGGSSADFVRENGPMTPSDATRVVTEVARALSAAHALGIVHRDIKPANIMLGPAWMVKVTDFGLAKMEGGGGPDEGRVVMGTPGYMSPEAWDGRPTDGRSDIYSLGATYYALLTGRPPYHSESSEQLAEMHRKAPIPDPRARREEVPPDCSAVIAKAMAKDPADRYANAEQMVADLEGIDFGSAIHKGDVGGMQNWAELAAAQSGVMEPEAPISAAARRRSGARPASVRLSGIASVRRKRVLGRLALMVGAALAAGSLTAWAVLHRAPTPDAVHPVAEVKKPAPPEPTVTIDPPGTDPSPPDPGDAGEAPEPERTNIPEPVIVPADPVLEEYAKLSTAAWDAGRRPDKHALDAALARLSAFAEKHRDSTDPRRHDVAAQAAVDVERFGREPEFRGPVGAWEGHTEPVLALAVAADGRTIATAGRDDTIRIWYADGRLRHVLTGRTADVTALAFLPDSRTLAAGGADGQVVLWDTFVRRDLGSWAAGVGPIRAMAAGADGKALAVVGSAVRVWDVAGRRELYRLDLGRPDGAETKPAFKKGAEPSAAAANGLALTPDGKTLITVGAGGAVKLWDAATGAAKGDLVGHTAEVLAVAVSPDGKSAATSGIGGLLHIWDLTSGKERTSTRAHTGPVFAIAFSHDGQMIVTAGADLNLRLWDAHSGRPLDTLQGHLKPAAAAAFLPGDKALLSAGADLAVRVWDVTRPAEPVSPAGHTGPVNALAWSPNSKTLATAGEDLAVRLWNPADGRLRAALPGHKYAVLAAAWSADGRLLATAGRDRAIAVWDAIGGKLKTLLREKPEVVRALAFSPDGRTLAAGGREEVRLWNLESGKIAAVLKGHTQAVRAVAWSGNGLRIYTASDDGTARIWDAAGAKEITVLNGHAHVVTDLAVSPDGAMLATASADHTVRLWDADTGRERAILSRHVGPVLGVDFSPDGKTLVSCGSDKTVRLWTIESRRQKDVLLGHEGPVNRVRFAPDGKSLASAGTAGAVRIWPVGAETAPKPPKPPKRPAADGDSPKGEMPKAEQPKVESPKADAKDKRSVFDDASKDSARKTP